MAFVPELAQSLTMRLWMKNITDEEYAINFYSQASGSAYSSAPGAPRTYGLELQYQL